MLLTPIILRHITRRASHVSPLSPLFIAATLRYAAMFDALCHDMSIIRCCCQRADAMMPRFALMPLPARC